MWGVLVKSGGILVVGAFWPVATHLTNSTQGDVSTRKAWPQLESEFFKFTNGWNLYLYEKSNNKK